MKPRRDPLRVLLVAARYFPYVGGVETHVYEVSRRLADAGVDVTVLVSDPSGRLPADEQAEGVRILRVYAWPIGQDYYIAPRIYRIINHGGWDLVNCVGYHTLVAPLAMLAAWQAKIPYIVTFQSGGHSSRLRIALRWIQWAMLRPLLARAERLVAVSEFEAEFLQAQMRLSPERFVVIPNGADLPPVEKLDPVPPDDGPLIISVGRLEHYKGHHRVIAALPKVLEHCPNTHLQIIGTGPFREELCRLAARLDVAHRVKIMSVKGSDRREMARLLSSANLMTLLSEYESQGIAVMEALALGCPALVTETAALREIAEHGYARAVPLDASTEVIASAILDQILRPLAPTGIIVPTWDACATGLLRLYRETLGGD